MTSISVEQLQSTLIELNTRRKSLLYELRVVEKALDGVGALISLDGGVDLTDANANDPVVELFGLFQSMPAAVDLVLQNADGSLTFSEIKSLVKSIDPPVRAKNIESSLSATLSRGHVAGKYARIEHGLYRWAQEDLGI